MKGTIPFTGAGSDDSARQADESNKQVRYKICAALTKCINKLRDIKIDSTKDLHAVAPMYNLIDYSNNYAETSRRLWQCCRDKLGDDNTTDSESFKFKTRITGRILSLTIPKKLV